MRMIYQRIFFVILILGITSINTCAQEAINYLKVQGNDGLVYLRIISENDAITSGNGVVKIQLENNVTGAADLVPDTDPSASEVRIQTPYGTRAWKKEVFYSTCYGGTEMDKAFAMSLTSNGGIALCGMTSSYGAGGFDFMFMKTSLDGSFNWGKALGYESSNGGKGMIETTAGGYYLTGYAYNPTYSCYYAYVYHLNSSGNILLEGGYGTSTGNEFGEDCIQASDNNFVIAGKTNGLGAGGYDLYIKKVDYTDGSNIWGWALGTTENDEGHALLERTGGGYVVVGQTNTGTDWNIYFLLLNSGGSSDLSLSIGGDNDDYGRDVALTSDGGYAIAGFTSSYGAGGNDYYLRKQDADGDPVWAHTYGGSSSDYCYSVIETSDNSFVMVGETASFNVDFRDLWIVKADSEGEAIWSWVFGGTGREAGYDVWEAADGTLYVCGEVSSYGAGNEDALLVKFAADGSTCLGHQIGFTDDEFNNNQSDLYTARKIEIIQQSIVQNDAKNIPVKSTALNGDLQIIFPFNKDETSITPTTTTICD